ncbi:hypothetical protein GGR52DRAFT_30874 [Hypoxylon sp. FL1284]|nr:hypothetical protein GGR52DRAFT_30874 [Hypoxylon sp. FL1284]
MQKILRRVATAERVAAKRAKAAKKTIYRVERTEKKKNQWDQLAQVREELATAKQAVRDDWELGPLAPRRDVGAWSGAGGAVHETRYGVNAELALAQRNRRCRWAGGAYNLNVVVGDRVVLVDGPEKGQIGKISSIDKAKAELVVDGLNKSNIRVIPQMRMRDEPPVFNLELPMPISSVRLVHPLRDPATGVTRDVVINQLVHANMVRDRVTGERRWSRVVPGLNVEIPWPPRAEPDHKDHKGDTLRIDVEDRTFVPTLLRPPMPQSVLDELRGRYSRFRTRHEPEYIARLEAEERAAQDRKKLMKSMRTPLQELHRADRDRKKKKGKPRLTLEMLEKIGEVMAKNMERTRNSPALAGALTPDDTTSPASTSSEDAAAAAVPPTPEAKTPTSETEPPPST